MKLLKHIRLVPDFPEKGILFRDITPILASPAIFQEIINTYNDRYRQMDVDSIAAIDSRGFIFGAAVAYAMKLPLVLIRKQGKLPAERYTQSHILEYGTSTLEIHKDSIAANSKVVIFDDLLATGGTAMAAAGLVEKCQGRVVEFAFLIELEKLKGNHNLKDYPIFSLIKDGR